MKNKMMWSVSALVLMSMAHTTAGAKADENAPKLEFSGEANAVGFSFAGKEKDKGVGKGQGTQVSIINTRLNAEIKGAAPNYNDMQYSALIGITGNTESGNNPIEETRIMLKSVWGTFLAGATKGVENRMAVGAFSVMGATGGFDGSWDDVVNKSTGINTSINMSGDPKWSNKLVYFTPRVYGLQFGVSYAPNTSHTGGAKLKTFDLGANSSGTPYAKNAFSLGLNHRTKFNCGLNMRLSATANFSKTQPFARSVSTTGMTPAAAATYTGIYTGERHRTTAYALGALFEYGGFDFGLEFIDNGKSQALKAVEGQDAGQVMSVAAGYTFGVNKFAVGYLHSERKLGKSFKHNGAVTQVSPENPKAKADVVSVTYDRKLAPGLMAFADGTVYKMRTDSRWVAQANAVNAADNKAPVGIGNNNGHVMMVGVKARF